MKKISSIIFALAFILAVQPVFASQGVVEWQGGCLSFTKNLGVGSRDTGKSTDVRKLQMFLNYQSMLKTPPTGYFGISTSKALLNYQKAVSLKKKTGTLNADTRVLIEMITCSNVIPPGPLLGNNAATFKATSKEVGLIESGAGSSYQVNLSFIGGTKTKPVTEWRIQIECPTGVDVDTVPGAACGEFVMGHAPGTDGNIINKEFWIKNNTNKQQIVKFKAYATTISGPGQTNELVIKVPVTVVGPTSWSDVRLLSQNNGEVYQAGQTIDIYWSTTRSDYYDLTSPSATANIMVLKDRMNVYRLEGLVNDGHERITLPTTLEAGSDYRIDVAVYLGEHGQSDQSDKTFTVVK